MSEEPMREVERRKLNVIEALIVFALISLIGATLYQAKAMVELQTTAQFMRDDIKGLREQLTQVPDLTRGQAELKVRVDRLDEDVKELRATRGLK